MATSRAVVGWRDIRRHRQLHSLEGIMSRARYACLVLVVVGGLSRSLEAAEPLLSGKVTDELGRSLNTVSVALESLDRTTRLTMVTGPDGLFRFDNIPTGRYSLSARQPDYVLAVYGPLVVTAGRSLSLNVQLARLPNDGRDLVTCEMSLVRGQARGAKEASPARMLFCLNGPKTKACTHLTERGLYSLSVLPGKYELTLQGPQHEELVSQLIDVSYCGEYRSRISLLE